MTLGLISSQSVSVEGTLAVKRCELCSRLTFVGEGLARRGDLAGVPSAKEAARASSHWSASPNPQRKGRSFNILVASVSLVESEDISFDTGGKTWRQKVLSSQRRSEKSSNSRSPSVPPLNLLGSLDALLLHRPNNL